MEPHVTVLSNPQRGRPVRICTQIPHVHYVENATQLQRVLPATEVLVVWDFAGNTLTQVHTETSALQWVHAASAGVNTLRVPWLIDLDPIVTNARGIFDRPIAEFVLNYLLMIAKDAVTSLDHQRQHTWKHRETRSLAHTRALIVGTGGIGREIARTLSVLGVQVAGAGRRARQGDPDFGEVYDSAALTSAVAGMDWVINVTPLTEATTGLFDANVFAAMEPTAHFINVGRGASVITDDLVAAVSTGQIAGCALDVVDPEPLPAQHPLWTLPGVLLTPHMSGDTHGWEDRLQEQFLALWESYCAGEPFAHPVDLDLGFVSGNHN